MTDHQARPATQLVIAKQARGLTDSVAKLLAEGADSLILPRYRKLGEHEIATKTSATDLVTIADTETEAWLTPKLAALIAGSLVVGEEAVAGDPGLMQAFDGNQPVWVIDPVDGTRNFANGEGAFVTMLALVVQHRPIAGWIWRPLTRELVWAVQGFGAFLRHEVGGPDMRLEIEPHDTKPLDALSGFVSYKWLPEEMKAQVKSNRNRAKSLNNLGCAGEEYALIAQGKADFAVFGLLKPWDHCPGIAIVREAGGADMLFGEKAAYSTAVQQDQLITARSLTQAQMVASQLFS